MTTQRKRAFCSACHMDFEYDWKALAVHISSMKDKAHKRSRKFAARVLTNVDRLNMKKAPQVRVAMTDQDKENKVSTRLELSGENEAVNIYCPDCHAKGLAYLPIEFTQSQDAWKIDGRFPIICGKHYLRGN